MFNGIRKIILLSSDAIAMCFAAFVTYAVTLHSWSLYPHDDTYRLLMVQIILSLTCLFYFTHKGHYTWRNPWWAQVRQTIRTCFILALISLLINLVTLPDAKGMQWIAVYWTLSAACVLNFRWVGRNVLKIMKHWDIPTILVGGASNLTETIYALRSEVYLTYDIQYVVVSDNKPEDVEALKAAHGNINIVSELGDIPHRAMVILCPDEYSSDFMKDSIDKIRQAGARFAIVPPTKGFSLYGLQTQFFFGHKIVLLESRNRIQTFWGTASKWLMDKVGAAFALLIFSPLFIILAMKIRKDGGPAFYAQVRIGKGGKKFKCWKFRSMIYNADEVLKDYLDSNPAAKEEYARDFKLKDDPRITAVGHILRKSSLDEIPQFFNVLKGDMSLVGPRPVVDAETAYYGDKLPYYLSVRPGVTGLWQVSGRNDVTYDQRVALDVWYVENWSLWNDLVIILKTIYVVIARKGAY